MEKGAVIGSIMISSSLLLATILNHSAGDSLETSAQPTIVTDYSSPATLRRYPVAIDAERTVPGGAGSERKCQDGHNSDFSGKSQTSGSADTDPVGCRRP